MAKEKVILERTQKKLGKYKKLHQLFMIHWYGKEALEEAYAKDFIIEHMDNDAFDCSIENLSFAPNNVNIAKGFTYDLEREEATPIVALIIFKDFDTEKFQITVGFKRPMGQVTKHGFELVNSLRLVYKNDYRRTLLDAQDILYKIVTN